FMDNELLKSVSISANITSIDSRAFHNCPNLEEIKVASDNEYFQSIDGVLYSKDGKSLIRYPNGKNGNSFTIPNQVKKICDGAFNGYGLELKEVVLPNEIEYIGNSGLATMGGLDNGRVTMMLNCTEKDGGYYLGSVENPYLAFAGVVSRKIDSVSIHTDTKFILSWAFNLSEVKSVKIPNGVVQLGAESFSYCARLNSVSLPLSLKNIGKDAFFQCTALKSVSFTIAKNWYVDDLLMAEAELQDVATAAKYLSTTYCGNEWERKIIIAEDEN
ncbi:MAG: leucine-rich repeat protein, partial [Clostridia bacterium]|nr:leucine-rich repeat protein [Clostridia bacterium]